MRPYLIAALAVLLVARLPAGAQAPASARTAPTSAPPAFKPPPIASLPPCPASNAAAQPADEATVKAALQTAQSGGLRALAPQLDGLKQALEHAPTGLAPLERCGSDIVVTSSFTDFMIYSLAYASDLRGQKAITRVTFKPSPYPLAAFLIGSFDNEVGDYAAAVPALRLGLAMEPMEAALVTEAASALSQLKRYDEALALCDGRLKQPDTLDKRDHGRLLRARGTALEGLGRLGDAAAAYRDSLNVEPGNPIALNELGYIAGLRLGAPATEPRLTQPAKPPPSPTTTTPAVPRSVPSA